MNYYIGTKLIQATPSWRHTGTKEIFDDGKQPSVTDLEYGYKVKYSDGYESWSPKEVFEKFYLKVDDNKNLISGVSIGIDMVKNFIKEKHVSTIGEKTTLVRVVLVNGFEIIESSSCVDKANYNQEIGAQCCMNKIESKILNLLGFLLQTACMGYSGNRRNVKWDKQ